MEDEAVERGAWTTNVVVQMGEVAVEVTDAADKEVAAGSEVEEGVVGNTPPV